ncbi:hypothetical protein GQ44DRAFT_739533 [Phaeosphaeriaceae sp. PMI808]|nr:hypothetical protein GQ44DRAFT_739533 [Phaeosphaeriaceae sp. PMI808]
MSRHTYTAFQKHLIFFSTPTNPPKLTLLSSLRAALSLSLNFPIAIFLSISLRLVYAPYPYLVAPINIERIPQSAHRTQLKAAKFSKSDYTCPDLLSLLESDPRKGFIKHAIDQRHVMGFWTMAANAWTHTVSRDDVERFQQGEWEAVVAKGGPMFVSGHSWAARKLLGVRVYEARE